MSDIIDAPAEGAVGEAAVDAGLEIEHPDFDGEAQPEGIEPAAPSVLDFDQFGDHLVTVKVGGEELQVPLREALAGYSRQADYTRKTQELATERQQLAFARQVMDALEQDPVQALYALAEAYGIKDAFDVEDLDPRERELAAYRARESAAAAREATARVQREMDALSDRYKGIEIDQLKLLEHAANGEFASLEAAFRDLYFDEIIDLRAAQQRKADEERARRERAKREAAGVEGGSRGRVELAPAPSDGRLDIRQAFALAKKQHRA